MNWPTTIQLTIKQYETLIERDDFDAFIEQLPNAELKIGASLPQ